MRHRVLNGSILLGMALIAAACATVGSSAGSVSDGSGRIAFKRRSVDGVPALVPAPLTDARRDGSQIAQYGCCVDGPPRRGFAVVRLAFSARTLPPAHATMRLGNSTYYGAAGAYYLWNSLDEEYEVVAPPSGIEFAICGHERHRDY